ARFDPRIRAETLRLASNPHFARGLDVRSQAVRELGAGILERILEVVLGKERAVEVPDGVEVSVLDRRGVDPRGSRDSLLARRKAATRRGDQQQREEEDKAGGLAKRPPVDRKSTRLNSSHVKISYAVFCLK